MSYDPLGESSVETAMKCLIVMFTFLALLASPLISASIGGQLGLIAASISGVAAGSTADEFAPKRDVHTF